RRRSGTCSAAEYAGGRGGAPDLGGGRRIGRPDGPRVQQFSQWHFAASRGSGNERAAGAARRLGGNSPPGAERSSAGTTLATTSQPAAAGGTTGRCERSRGRGRRGPEPPATRDFATTS